MEAATLLSTAFRQAFHIHKTMALSEREAFRGNVNISITISLYCPLNRQSEVVGDNVRLRCH